MYEGSSNEAGVWLLLLWGSEHAATTGRAAATASVPRALVGVTPRMMEEGGRVPGRGGVHWTLDGLEEQEMKVSAACPHSPMRSCWQQHCWREVRPELQD